MLKKRDLLVLWETLNRLGDISDFEMALFLARTTNAIREEVREIHDANRPVKEFGEFEAARMALIRECSEKDERGLPLLEGNSYVIRPECRDDFDRRVNELRAECAAAIEEENLRRQKFADYLETEVEHAPTIKIAASLIPRGQVRASDLTAFDLFGLIEDGPPEP